MNFIETSLPGVMLIEPRTFEDERGFFMETHNAARFREAGIDVTFVQDNHSRSAKNVVRGLHYQHPNAQGKLVRVIAGVIFDVAVDIRRGSPTFGKWFGTELSAANRRQLWVPPGFAHGLCALTDDAEVLYKCTALYDAPNDRAILWNDPDLAIVWPIRDPILSKKDAAAPRLRDAALPEFQV